MTYRNSRKIPGSFRKYWNVFKIIRKYSEAWAFCMACRNSTKILSTFRKSWSICKFTEKYSEPDRNLYGL